MARNKEEIFDAIMVLKNADPIISTILTSSSKASFYQSLFVLFSDIAGDFELTFDAFLLNIENVFETKQIHTLYWLSLIHI